MTGTTGRIREIREPMTDYQLAALTNFMNSRAEASGI